MKSTARVKEILDKTHLMSLGVRDDKGVWVADVIFVHDDNLSIFWMSDPETRHSQAMAKNKQVAGTITFSTKCRENNLGIQFEGTAHKIDGPRYDLAVKHYAKRNKDAPKETDDVLEGDSWYELKISKLYLIDEENFGFERQTIV